MLGKLDQHFSFNENALRLRAYRSEVLASNLANADTPHFKARDFEFAQVLQQSLQTPNAFEMSTTHGQHLQTFEIPNPMRPGLMYRMETQPSIDGNTVETDVEMAQFSDNALRYQAELAFINNKIAGLRSALQDR